MKFPAFYVTRSVITVFIQAPYRSLPSARWSQSIRSVSTFWTFILILSSNLLLHLPLGLFLSLSHQNSVRISYFLRACFMPHLPRFLDFIIIVVSYFNWTKKGLNLRHVHNLVVKSILSWMMLVFYIGTQQLVDVKFITSWISTLDGGELLGSSSGRFISGTFASRTQSLED
jgi:hypothetical protein